MQVLIIIIIIVIIGFIYYFTKKDPQKNIKQEQSLNKNEDLFTVKNKDIGFNIAKVTIDISDEEVIKLAKEDILKNGLEINNTIEDITGFYGSDEYSPNQEYCVSFCDGYYNNDKWENGDIALVKGETLLFKKKIKKPDECHVSDDGIVICCDLQNSNILSGCFLIYNATGKRIFSIKTTANIGASAISANSKIAIFETGSSNTDDSNKIFVVDIEGKKIIQQFKNPSYFISANIDTDNKLIKFIDPKGFTFEIDFEGNQTNKDDYEKQIMSQGSVCDRLWLYGKKSNDVKYKDANYLALLINSLTDKSASYVYGKDCIYRKIGEYYEASGDIINTIENWEKAIQINPKIGVKRKLEVLKKKL